MAEDSEPDIRFTPISEIAKKEDVSQQLTEAIKIGMGATSMMIIKELKKAVESPDVVKYLDRGVVVYLAAAGTLAYAGKDVYSEDIAKLVTAAGMTPKQELLDAVRLLHYKNHLIYINSVYYLTFLGKEPTIDGVIEVIKAIGASPDATIAGYVIEFCKEYNTLRYTTVDTGSALNGPALEVFKQLSSGVIELSDTMVELVLKEMDRMLKNKDVQAHMGPKMMPYIGAIGSLAFSGKDMDRNSVSLMLKAAGITPESEYLELIAKMRFKNQLIYVQALYFLIIAGVDPTPEYLFNVLKAMNTPPDALIGGYVIAYYKMKKLAGGFKWLKI